MANILKLKSTNHLLWNNSIDFNYTTLKLITVFRMNHFSKLMQPEDLLLQSFLKQTHLEYVIYYSIIVCIQLNCLLGCSLLRALLGMQKTQIQVLAVVGSALSYH